MEYRQRKMIRLEEYDYSQDGWYFVTICTIGKQKILCSIDPPKSPGEEPFICMTDIGKTVFSVTEQIPGIEKYVVMPNHVHLLIHKENRMELSSVIRIYKINLTRKIGKSIFQARYYDHVIRDEEDYRTKWNYIDENPAKWANDDYYI